MRILKATNCKIPVLMALLMSEVELQYSLYSTELHFIDLSPLLTE